jgi:hypothetical protein
VRLLSLVLGCAHHVAPAVFPVSLPVVPEPRHPVVEAEPGDCAEVVPYAPGEAPGCTGLLVPPVTLAGYLHAETMADYWQAQAGRCAAGRAMDREHGQALYGACWDGWRETEKRERQLRVWVPIGLGLVGAGAFVAGYEAGRVLP